MNVEKLSNKLDYAARRGKAIPQLSKKEKFTLTQAYAIQAGIMDLKYSRGEEFVGVKMGFTSKEKMEQMGVHDLIWGRITDKMQVENGGELDFSRFIHPRAEPEIAFKLAVDVEELITIEELVEGNIISHMAPAIEIIDSRYKNFKFSLEDVVADNCSSAAFVLGNWIPFNAEAANNLHVQLSFNGEEVQTGTTRAILRNPVEAVYHAIRLALKYNQELPAGSIVLAGAATAAEYFEHGALVEAQIGDWEKVSFAVN